MVSAVIAGMQVAAGIVATCTASADPQQRVWLLEQDTAGWRVVFRSRALDRPQIVLRIPNTSPAITANEIRLSHKSANGGRTIEWRITNGPSTLDLYVNHGLEVNVEADLDPAVDLMNSDGPIDVACVMPGAGRAESADVRAAPLSTVPSEWMIAAGVARSINLFQSTSGRAYAVQTIGWGRELTREWGPGIIRGRFAWAVEAMPVFAQFEPSSIYGIGFAPLVWRWNFTPRARWSAFAELSMGGMWSTSPIPEKAGRGNFTAHWGAGARRRLRGTNALVLAYRFQHFSNGNQLGSNPGVNSHVVLLGWSHRS